MESKLDPLRLSLLYPFNMTNAYSYMTSVYFLLLNLLLLSNGKAYFIFTYIYGYNIQTKQLFSFNYMMAFIFKYLKRIEIIQNKFP